MISATGQFLLVRLAVVSHEMYKWFSGSLTWRHAQSVETFSGHVTDRASMSHFEGKI